MSKESEAILKVENDSLYSKYQAALKENKELREELERIRVQLKECKNKLKDKSNK